MTLLQKHGLSIPGYIVLVVAYSTGWGVFYLFHPSAWLFLSLIPVIFLSQWSVGDHSQVLGQSYKSNLHLLTTGVLTARSLEAIVLGVALALMAAWHGYAIAGLYRVLHTPIGS